MWTGSASRSCCPAEGGGGADSGPKALLTRARQLQPDFIRKFESSPPGLWGGGTALPLQGWPHRTVGERVIRHAWSLDGVCIWQALWVTQWRFAYLTATGVSRLPVPPDSYVKLPAPQNATLSGHRSLQMELVKMKSCWSRVHPESHF